MAVSQTSLINKALTLCGAAPITNITDDTNNARIASRVYEIALKSILTECKWTFATTRATLSLSADTMPFYHGDEAYVYVRPADALRVFRMSDKYATWREMGDYIVSDTASLGIEYVYYHSTPSKYPPKFLEAFIDKLCSDVSFMIINDVKTAEGFLAKYEKVSLPKAMAENSQTGTQQEPRDDAWINSRFHNSSPEA